MSYLPKNQTLKMPTPIGVPTRTRYHCSSLNQRPNFEVGCSKPVVECHSARRATLTTKLARTIEVGYPIGSNLRGLARATFQSDIPPWEFDIRAVPPGTDPVQISDWHRRHGRANNEDRNIERAAEALAESLPAPEPATKAPARGRR